MCLGCFLTEENGKLPDRWYHRFQLKAKIGKFIPENRFGNELLKSRAAVARKRLPSAIKIMARDAAEGPFDGKPPWPEALAKQKIALLSSILSY